MSNLTEKEIRSLSLGYNWNPDMSEEEFTSKNRLGIEEGSDIYNQINDRYIYKVYEEDGKTS